MSGHVWRNLRQQTRFLIITTRHCSTTSTRVAEKKRKVGNEKKVEEELTPRFNALGIQMLSSSIHSQIFKCEGKKKSNLNNSIDSSEEYKANVRKSIEHLKQHHLWGKESSVLPEVDFKLPKLFGENLDEHFREIAKKQSDPYRKLVTDLSECNLPEVPEKWNFQSGWTKYLPNGKWEVVDFPDDCALVFDVEVCLSEGKLPTLATAVSTKCWYSWCSPQLTEKQFTWPQKTTTSNLIPLETKLGESKPPDNGIWKERIIVGHNVSFDRARIKEQYFLKGPKTRLVDTMSLHIATTGITSFQRSLLLAEGTDSKRKDVQEAKAKLRGPPNKDWMKVSSLNNLGDVYRLHCGGKRLEKEPRNIFVNGTLDDVRENFQHLMTYCSRDVSATQQVLQKLLPVFFERFPHPATFAGMLEMSVAYLPVNQNWEYYLTNAQSTFDDLEWDVKIALMHLANEACHLLDNEKYKKDPWLSDLDWSTQELRMKKTKIKNKVSQSVPVKAEEFREGFPPKYLVEEEEETPPSEFVQNVYKLCDNYHKKQPFMPGYPKWYSELCIKDKSRVKELNWRHRRPLISVQMRVTPKLLRLTWDGYPLHYNKIHGWGYLIPIDNKPIVDCDEKANDIGANSVDYLWEQLESGLGDPEELSRLFQDSVRKQEKKKKTKMADSKKTIDVGIPGYWFSRLPHKNGPGHRVGNPLAKDFLNKVEDGTLKSHSGAEADHVLRVGKMTSYWRNANKRIISQITVWLKKSELPRNVTRNLAYREENNYGAILPQIVTAGTVTRRAVEPTWLTASNAYPDRVGSELKSMVQVPPGYKFVGADVDSQELWIAAILGDKHFAGIHGCTAFGWMTLQGKKSDATDMHSRTASTVGISRDHAKVMNYGRIYGAGQPFAQQLLMQFNHRLSEEEAKNKAEAMFAATKGIRGYVLNETGRELFSMWQNKNRLNDKIILTKGEVLQMLNETSNPLHFQDVISKSVWIGGTESAMFNQLEEIAQSSEPATPVLGCRISQSLEPSFVNNNFMTSRVNWVVQSSAVDYLHLMLVSMRWLCDTFDIDARFSISIHDEVRYLVKEEDTFRAALALQITNLLTRSLFAIKLGMDDLPQSVAFFSAVDVDSVLRKEVTMDCVTPSNQFGLCKGFGISPGEALDIYTILEKTKGSLKVKK